MEVKDIATLTVASLGLLVSAINFYFSQLRKPMLSIKIGPQIHIWYTTADLGGTGIYLPIIAQNTSARSAIIQKCYLSIRHPDGRFHTLRWSGFNEIHPETKDYNYIDAAAPVFVSGNSSSAKLVSFFSGALAMRSPVLRMMRGKYEFTLYVWLSDAVRPEISTTEQFELSQAGEEIFENKLKENDLSTRIFTFHGRSLAGVTSDAPVKFEDLIENERQS